MATLSVNGRPGVERRIEEAQPNVFSADETADVGIDDQIPLRAIEAADLVRILPVHRLIGAGVSSEHLLEVRTDRLDFVFGEEVAEQGDALASSGLYIRVTEALVWFQSR